MPGCGGTDREGGAVGGGGAWMRRRWGERGTDDYKLWHFQNPTIFMKGKQQVTAFGNFAVTSQWVWDKMQGRTQSQRELPQSVSVQPYCSIAVQLEGVPMHRRVQSDLQAGDEHSRAETSSLVGKSKLCQPAHKNQQETNDEPCIVWAFMVTSMLMSCGKKEKQRRRRRRNKARQTQTLH